MTDYISKSALKDAFEEDGHLSAYVEEMIDSVPDADVREVKRGEWLETSAAFRGYADDGTALKMPTRKCSNCGKTVAIVMWDNFCPNCGVDMREES